MLITLSNGTKLALADDLAAEVVSAQIELAEEEIAEKRAAKLEAQRETGEEEPVVPVVRGRRK